MAGTVATDRPLTLEVTEIGENTALAGIQRLRKERQVERDEQSGEQTARQPGGAGHAGRSGSPSFRLPMR